LTIGRTMTNPLWLNLGCSDDIKDGFVNVDKDPVDDRVLNVDLAVCWPWQDSTVDYILAKDCIEHLPDKIKTMNEAYRVLKPGGVFEVHVPTSDGRGAFQDPTHVSYWNRHSFWYFEDGNIYRERFANAYWISARFKVLKENQITTSDGPYLMIVFQAVKDEQHSA
jgi:SAM-dependent methyltransferase